MAGPTEAQTLNIDHGSPRENGYCESSNRKLSEEFLHGEIFNSTELFVLADGWRVVDRTFRPDSLLGYNPAEPEAWLAGVSRRNGSEERFPLYRTPTSATSQVVYPARQANNPTGIEHRAG